jgi:hypothetical protein
MVYFFRNRATKLTMNKEFVRSITVRNTCFERSGILFWSRRGWAQSGQVFVQQEATRRAPGLPVM